MAIHNITTTETLAVLEALELANDELKAAEDDSDWVITNGADEFIQQAVVILRSVLKTSGDVYD